MAYKWTDGWLCSDDDEMLRFFPMPEMKIYKQRGYWYRTDCDLNYEFWSLDEWAKAYDLKPPAKGKRFYISIQL